MPVSAEDTFVPFDEAFARLGLSDALSIVSVPSGYPSPKLVNLVLHRSRGRTLLFESAAHREDIVAATLAAIRSRGIDRLDGVLVTHCHGDHAGSAGAVSALDPARPAPIHVHSAGAPFLVDPEATFDEETRGIFRSRARFGVLSLAGLTPERMHGHPKRVAQRGYFRRVPQTRLRYVDRGQLPDRIVAVPTPGHAHDCVLYYDTELEVAVPGDTIIARGLVEDPASRTFVIPIFTAYGQPDARPFDGYLLTIRRLRRFFASHRVRAVLPPHGRFAVLDPSAWVGFAEDHFRGLYRSARAAMVDSQRGDREPLGAADLGRSIERGGAHAVSTPSHLFAMLWSLVERDYLAPIEDPETGQVTFRVRRLPPEDYLDARLAEDPGDIPIHRAVSPLADR